MHVGQKRRQQRPFFCKGSWKFNRSSGIVPD